MDITIQPGKLTGNVHVIPSKSQAHRYLICAAFSKGRTVLVCPQTSQDIEATADCLRSLGASILRTENGYAIDPISNLPEQAVLHCRESGSTLRFLLPIVGALGVDATFEMEGRLPQRPLSPLWEEMERMGCQLSRPTANEVRCHGKLQPGDYYIDGSVSSQYITGLYFALPLISGETSLYITGKLESRPYVRMTIQAMRAFDYPYSPAPGEVHVEGDWSNGAFWLAATALGCDLKITNLDPKSPQGDRKIAELLPQFQENITISVSDIPDLVPILSVVAAANNGATFTDIQRLRLKESDRVAATIAMLRALGGQAEATSDTMTVYPSALSGGIVDSFSDHRIAMSAAIASTICKECVTILDAECVKKSYPGFWEEFKHLGGKYELYLR